MGSESSLKIHQAALVSTLNYLMCIVSGERQFSSHHTYEILMVTQSGWSFGET